MSAEQTRRFDHALRDCLGSRKPEKIGVALSGGGDSTALLLMLSDWAGVPLAAVTVNHGLRKEASDEASRAARLCDSLGIAHTTLLWSGWDKQGNLQDAARQARRRLISTWAQEQDIPVVALGHTLDDQAETFLLRLARGSGVDGLAAMQRQSHAEGLVWIRPLLDWRRTELREFLTTRGVDWSEDPSNEDPRFDRIKMRKALTCLSEAGIEAERLAETAERLQLARRALEEQCLSLAQTAAQINAAGDVELTAEAFQKAPQDQQRRLMAHALKWVATSPYRPRLKALEGLLQAVAKGGGTLGGCLVTSKRGIIRISREPKAVAGATSKAGEIWDGRWRITGPEPEAGVEIRALGETALIGLGDRRTTDLPRTSLIASPSVWKNNELLAAPLAGWPNGWSAELEKGANHFYSSILSH